METPKRIFLEQVVCGPGVVDGGVEGEDMELEMKSGGKGDQNAQQ
jgi:hypothetical protein